jgi:hypothetical protein
MPPEFEIALEFFKTALVNHGYSKNIQWLFRENIIVRQDKQNTWNFILNTELNQPNQNVKTIYNTLKSSNSEIFFFTFIQGKDLTYASIAGDDFDFDPDEGDILRTDWNLKFSFNTCFEFDKHVLSIENNNWNTLKTKETKHLNPFDYFYLSSHFK